jgi:photosystem II stability/assembly factor-like uncharacterized protein
MRAILSNFLPLSIKFPIEPCARSVPIYEMGSNLKALHLAFFLVFFSGLSVFGQWSPVNSGTTNNLNGAYLLDSGSGFVVGDAGTILKTTDAGATWAPLTSGTTTTLHDIYLFNPNEGVAVGEGGLILRTTDGGAGWQSVASGVKDSLRSVSFSGVNGICGGDSQTILYSADSGASWQIGQSGFFGGGFPGAHMLSATQGFVAGQNSIFQPLVGNSTDGGATWNFHAFYFDNNEGGCTDVFFFDQNTGVVSGVVFDGRGAIARTTDGGTNWSTSFYDMGIQGIDFPTAAIGFAVGWAGRILRTNDSGVTWDEQISGTSANLNDVNFFGNALTGIAVGEGGIILRTTNGGGPSPSVSINPSKDNTLYEYVVADGDRSNGVGDYFFAGKTATGLIRRGALAFDIAGSIPAGSTITSVSLSMHMSRTLLETAQTVELHKLLADWGEGTSDASGEEGDGAPATTNDATWRHGFYDTIFWATQGGDFSNTVSASQSVGAIGDYTWSSVQMVADVQSWLDNPVNNFGWLVLGNESASTTAKRFDTRERTSPPVLTIEYTAGPTPTPTPTPTATPSVTPPPRPTPGPSATPRGTPPPRPGQ